MRFNQRFFELVGIAPRMARPTGLPRDYASRLGVRSVAAEATLADALFGEPYTESIRRRVAAKEYLTQAPAAPPDKATVYEESGHAVAADSLSIGLFKATVVRDSQCSGHVWADYKRAPIEAQLQFFMAGPVAERISRGVSPDAIYWPGEGSDWQRITEIVEGQYGPSCVTTTPLFKNAVRETVALVKDNWPKVERLAAALRRKHTLYATEFDEVLNG